MSPPHGDPYNDPYSHQQRQYASEASFADAHANYGQSYAYHDANPYEEGLQYPSYPTDPSSGEYINDLSTEKASENVRYESTERAQPGRSGLRRPATSFAGLGPPPRSTGILRVWWDHLRPYILRPMILTKLSGERTKEVNSGRE